MKAEIFCYCEFPLENKIDMSFTYRVCESLHYSAIQQLFGECQIHTFHNKNIVYTSINVQNHK